MKVTVIELWRGKNGGWYFHTIARNGQIGTVSEAYSRRDSARRAAKRWHPGVPILVVKR